MLAWNFFRFVLDDVKDFVCFLSFRFAFISLEAQSDALKRRDMSLCDNKSLSTACALCMRTVMTIELLLERGSLFTVSGECRLSRKIKETNRNKESENKQKKNVAR